MQENPPPSDSQRYPRLADGTAAIFWISVLGLFLEMLLIRWLGTEIRIFAYLQNTILVVCFLGLGLGCFTCRKPIRATQSLVPLLILVILLSHPVTGRLLGMSSEFLSVLEDFLIWGRVRSTGLGMTTLFLIAGLGMIYLVLVLVLDVFVPVGRLLGRLMDDHPSIIKAYSVNIAGSLLGTWLFVFLSFLHLPPLSWFVVLALLAVPFLWAPGEGKVLRLVMLGAVVGSSLLASWAPNSIETIWSPYQKLVLRQGDLERGIPGELVISVNNAGYQSMIDLQDPGVKPDSDLFPPEMHGLSQYDIPLLLHPDPKTYLIVGAGAGNDAAGGLRQGVEAVTAVEIDPVIISMGKEYHPEAPYGSSKVTVVNDDARSFFSVTEERFDVISFGLLDSHTTTAMTNARLDHYVYTLESISRAKGLLREGGVMVLTFEAKKPYIADRMARLLREVFGAEPLAFRIPATGYGWGGVMFVSGDLAAATQQVADNERLAALIADWEGQFPLELSYTTKLTTDDWPYIYLESPRIPVLFFLFAGVMLLLLVRSYRAWGAEGLAARWTRSHWHFFFLGAGFLLLEVQNISKASVALGNTWQVNAVIVSGVLGMILLANLIAHRFPEFRPRIAYLGLIGTCVALYFIDLASFAFLPYTTKVIVVGLLTSVPLFFSGIIFIRSFQVVARKNEALGANLTGALVGALLQSATFVTGIKALLLIVAGLYLLSFLTRPSASDSTAAELLPA